MQYSYCLLVISYRKWRNLTLLPNVLAVGNLICCSWVVGLRLKFSIVHWRSWLVDQSDMALYYQLSWCLCENDFSWPWGGSETPPPPLATPTWKLNRVRDLERTAPTVAATCINLKMKRVPYLLPYYLRRRLTTKIHYESFKPRGDARAWYSKRVTLVTTVIIMLAFTRVFTRV